MKRTYLHIFILALGIAVMYFVVQIAFISSLNFELILNRVYASLGFFLLYFVLIFALLYNNGHFDLRKFKPIESLPAEIELEQSLNDIELKCDTLSKYKIAAKKEEKLEIHAKWHSYSPYQKIIIEKLKTDGHLSRYLISSPPLLLPFKLDFQTDVILTNELLNELQKTMSPK